MAKISEPEATTRISSSPTWPTSILPNNSEDAMPFVKSGPAGGFFCSAMAFSSGPQIKPTPTGEVSSRQRGLHQAARLGEIHLSGVLRLQDADHFAHVLHAGRTGFGNRSRDRRLHIDLRHLLRQIGGDD